MTDDQGEWVEGFRFPADVPFSLPQAEVLTLAMDQSSHSMGFLVTVPYGDPPRSLIFVLQATESQLKQIAADLQALAKLNNWVLPEPVVQHAAGLSQPRRQ
ncbi:hypothetical protein AB4Z01_14950 [Inquilinus sp. YAF38]|uniref:hypothetical protein n=1 Tax=Inquilinus sp. YAF38 TaxID=3233084 RepID=UPI003F8EB4FE